MQHLCYMLFVPIAMSSHASNTCNRKGPKAPSKPHGSQAKNAADKDGEDNPMDPKGRHVKWNSQHTEQLVEWLENNIEDRQRLFSDLAQDAKDESCCPCVAKSPKTVYHVKMANYIFSVDDNENVKDDLKANRVKYSKAVENCIA